MEVFETYQELVRTRLEELGIGAVAASTRAGLGKTYIRDLLRSNSNPRSDKLEKLAQALKLDPAALALRQMVRLEGANAVENENGGTPPADEIAKRTRLLREGKGLSQSELARKIGVSPQSIQALESGKVESPKYIVQLARALGVNPEFLESGRSAIEPVPVEGIRVEGVSKAGEFLDISLIEDDEHEREYIPAPRDAQYPDAHQYALRVDGDSMNKEFPNGSYVICAAWGDTGLDLESGMIVHVERYTAAGLRETTIKCYEVLEDDAYLSPLSTNKKHKPIPVNGDEDTEIVIKGLVVSKYERVGIFRR